MNEPKLEVRNITHKFRQKRKFMTVLQDINLELYSNEFVGIVGPSGCGKSTLLNIIAGLVKPTSGKVIVEGEVVPGPGSDRGMVFQSYTLYPWLTVAENIGFGLRLKGMPKAEQRDRIAYYLEIIGLTRFANAYPKQLSGGMKQRVAIARALVNEPEVLLMDEPFGALDAQTREQLQAFFHDLWEKTQITVLTITHDVEEAIFLCQRIYVMGTHPGSIQEQVTVNLPSHRTLDMKLTPEFLEIKRKIVRSLRNI
ncbi:ABC transporter ATP-binding protein [Geitlerinema sp. CS-897]|nr:ABC transporter ATP-binding protein [Geitlerinema sp. CS-897]